MLSSKIHSLRVPGSSRCAKKPVASPARQNRLQRILPHANVGNHESEAAFNAGNGQPTTGAGTNVSANKYNWTFGDKASGIGSRDDGRLVMDLPLAAIRRPLGRTRGNDQEKVVALMESIRQIGLQEPIDVLEVDGVYYGFSGCHRFEAHQRLGAETIRCRVRKATRDVLKMHLM